MRVLPALALAAAALAAAPDAGAQRPPEVLFAEGVLAAAAGDDGRAAELFAEVLAAEPDHPRAAQLRGRSLLALGEVDAAVEVLEPAARARPEDPSLALDLGLAYVVLGNLPFASRQLGRAVALDPASAAARMALGAVLSRLGECDLAARQLGRARAVDPALAAESRFLEGRCHMAGGDLDAAREAVEPLVEAPVSTPLLEASRRYVRIALRAEGIETAPFSGRLSLSLGFDSNPTLAPRDGELVQSFEPVLALDATVRALATARHTLAARVTAYRSFPLPDERAMAYSFTLVTGSAFYRFRGEAGGARHELHLGYDFALGLFDGGPPLTDPNHLYSEHHGGRLAWTLRETDALQSRLTLLVRHGAFSQLRRNNLGFTVAFGQTASLAASSLLLMLEATVRVEEARSADYDVVAPGLLAALTWTLPLRFTLSAWALYEHEDHPSSREGRVDELLTTSLSLERPLHRNVSLAVSWVHTEAFSTVSRFDHGRDLVSLTATGRL